MPSGQNLVQKIHATVKALRRFNKEVLWDDKGFRKRKRGDIGVHKGKLYDCSPVWSGLGSVGRIGILYTQFAEQFSKIIG